MCRIQEVRESRFQPIRVVIFSGAEPCNDHTEKELHPEDQGVHISHHFQVYPDSTIENCERENRSHNL